MSVVLVVELAGLCENLNCEQPRVFLAVMARIPRRWAGYANPLLRTPAGPEYRARPYTTSRQGTLYVLQVLGYLSSTRRNPNGKLEVHQLRE